MRKTGSRKGQMTKRRMKADSAAELFKFIHDEADHILGTVKPFLETTTINFEDLKMVRADARAIQKYAKQGLDGISRLVRESKR